MKIFALLITLVLVTVSARAGVMAGPFTNAANGHLYYLLDTDTWTNSEAQAVALGGHLATINNAAENQWVVDTFAHYDGVNRPLWIGLTDAKHEGKFRWTSDKPVKYTNWNAATGEPNNSGGSGYEEDFTYIIEEDSGNPDVVATFWNDAPDDGFGVASPLYGVVEVNLADVPVPTPVVRLQVCWPTVFGAQWRPAGSHGNWDDFGPPVNGTGGEVCVEGEPREGNKRVFRIVVL